MSGFSSLTNESLPNGATGPSETATNEYAKITVNISITITDHLILSPNHENIIIIINSAFQLIKMIEKIFFIVK